jgi:hypothetical protein
MVLTRQLLQGIVNKKSIMPFTQRNFLNTLRSIFKWAVSEGKSHGSSSSWGVVHSMSAE